MTATPSTDQPAPPGPTVIAELYCSTTRIARQAAIIDENRARLDGYRERYAGAPADYGTARADAKTTVDTAGTQLAGTVKEVGCRLDPDVKNGLDGAGKDVVRRLDECVQGTEGCRSTPWEPPAPPEKPSQSDLAGQVSGLRQQVAEEETYLEVLLAESTHLAERAGLARDAVAEVASEAGAAPPAGASDQEKAERQRALYARALAAAWQLEHVFGGYGDAKAYLECVGLTLTNVLTMWATIADLEGQKAYLVCIGSGSSTSCTALLADPAAAILERADKGGSAIAAD